MGQNAAPRLAFQLSRSTKVEARPLPTARPPPRSQASLPPTPLLTFGGLGPTLQAWEQQEEESCRRERHESWPGSWAGGGGWGEARTQEDEESGPSADSGPGLQPASGCSGLPHVTEASSTPGRQLLSPAVCPAK